MKIWFGAMTMLLLAGFAAFGQFEMLSSLPDVPELAASFTPGAWVDYAIKDAEGTMQYFKFSILSTEKEQDKEYYWFELKSTDKDGKWTIFKFKSTDPKDQQAAVSLIIQPMNEQPRQVDFMLPANRPVAPGTAEVNEPVKEAPKPEFTIEKDVTIEVPAGKFKCDKYTLIDEEGKTEIWVTPEVPIVGVARALRDGQGLTELMKFGKSGAKSEMVGETQKIEMPNLKELLKRPSK